jgi:hypothetical protein
MKKIIFVLFLLVIFLFSSISFAAQETLTFGWDQTVSSDLWGWKLWVGEATGGPYDKGGTYFATPSGDSLDHVFIPYDGSGQTSYTSDATILVPPDTETTLYFVLVACDEMGNCSEYSNEVGYNFDFLAPTVPFQFNIVASER